MKISVPEKVTVERITQFDSDGPGFYAWVMHDNHTFTKTLTGTIHEVAERVETIQHNKGMALYSLHHDSLDKETKLVTSRDIGKITAPETWLKPYNPLID